MSAVKEKLLELAEAVIEHFDLLDNMETFYQVEEIIDKNALLSPDITQDDVIKFFEEKICPQCKSNH